MRLVVLAPWWEVGVMTPRVVVEAEFDLLEDVLGTEPSRSNPDLVIVDSPADATPVQSDLVARKRWPRSHVFIVDGLQRRGPPKTSAPRRFATNSPGWVTYISMSDGTVIGGAAGLRGHGTDSFDERAQIQRNAR